jgi:dihydrofolate reductase
MRKIRYGVAASLDGYIAGPNGESDWITVDPEVDFAAIWAQFDTGLMGRRTYEAAVQRLGEAAFSGITTIVFSRTLKPDEHPTVKVFSEVNPEWVRSLKNQEGKDIWLFGGSALFRSFLELGHVDSFDTFIDSVSFVTHGTQLLGVLYAANAAPVQGPPAASNQIYVRWLQKKIVVTDSSGVQYLPQGSYGPDRQWFQVPASSTIDGTLVVYAEDGLTLLGSGLVRLTGGKSYHLVQP